VEGLGGLGRRLVTRPLATPRVRVRLEVDVAASTVGDVRVALRRPEIGVAQHLLHGAQVRASLEEVRRERMPQKVRVHAAGLEARTLGELAQDEERAGSRERSAARVQEELGTVAAIEMRATEREVPANGLGGGSSEGHEPLLPALAEDADDAFVERDARLLEPGGLGHAQPGTVEELDERAVAKRARRRPDGGVDESLGLGR
jgi:hypothetical protein